MIGQQYVSLFTFLSLIAYQHTSFAETENNVNTRVDYQLLRFNEDWSVLKKTLPDTDFFDPIKFISLNEENNIWLSLGGQARLRLESYDNFNFGTPNTYQNDDTYFSSRFLAHMDLHFGDHFRLFFEGINALTPSRDLPGGKRNIDVDSLDLRNAFFDLVFPLFNNSNLILRVGRQDLLFGSRRLVDPPFWTNTKRPLDGFAAIFSYKRWTLTSFWMRPVSVLKYKLNRTDDNVNFSGISIERQLSKKARTDLYFYRFGRRDTVFNGSSGDEKRYTVGLHNKNKLLDNNIDYDLEVAYQFGDIDGQKIDAWMMTTEVGYTIPTIKYKPSIQFGIDYATGDDELGGNVQTFNSIFPLGHASLGHIDVIGRQNIIDLRNRISLKPLKKLVFAMDSHYFLREDTDDALYNPGGRVTRVGNAGNSSEIGTEIDVSLKYKYDRHATILLEYTHFFPGNFIEESGAADDISSFYLLWQYTF